MKKKIHINQHKIRRNAKTGEREPVITVKTYKTNDYCNEVIIDSPCKVIYSPDKGSTNFNSQCSGQRGPPRSSNGRRPWRPTAERSPYLR